MKHAVVVSFALVVLTSCAHREDPQVHDRTSEHLTEWRRILSGKPENMLAAAQYLSKLPDEEVERIVSALDDNEKLYASYGYLALEKSRTIEAGWGRSAAFYSKLEDAIRSETIDDGNDHYYTVSITDDQVRLARRTDFPSERCTLTDFAVAQKKSGRLVSAYVFSDMGHAGIWGIIFSDDDITDKTGAYDGGRRYWMFSDVGDQLGPHAYQAWNNID